MTQDIESDKEHQQTGGVNVGDVGGDVESNVISGRDIIGRIINTGDHNKFFVGDYEVLQDAYLKPWEVFDRTSRLPFTGREWLLAEVDSFLSNNDRGYFILEANAGLGKTAFLACMIQQRGYIHHFCELRPGTEGVSAGLRNLAAQLSLAYELNPEGVLPDAASYPDYLYNILRDAVEKQDEGEKIVLVVDALDEAGTLGNQNVMGLPMGLPEGVYFVVSQRPSASTLKVKDPITTPRQFFRFSADNENNKADMRRFLEYAAESPEVVRVLQQSEHRYTSEQFITTLLNKCSGVWIYLYFVVQEIKQGDRSPLDLATLPNGMTQYYARYWQRWRDEDEEAWDEVHLPVLTMMAAAQESLSCQQLIELSGANIAERRLRRRLKREWRPFLTIAAQNSESRYRFYHATLQEFFDGRLEQENLSQGEMELVNELADETRKTHHRLAQRYLKAWRSWKEKLDGLRNEQLRDMDGRYGLRHLTAHLERAGRTNDLHRLLQLEWIDTDDALHPVNEPIDIDSPHEESPRRKHSQYQNVWYTTREAVGQTDGYVADIDRARRLAENRDFFQASADADSRWKDDGIGLFNDIGLQCRYALILASLSSLAENIPPGLMAALIEKGVWTPSQGLTYARQVFDRSKRVDNLVIVISRLPSEQQEHVLQEVLTSVKAIEDTLRREKALAELVPQLAELGHLEQALETAQAIEYSSSRVGALVNLVSYLSPDQQENVVQEALQTAQAIKNDYSRTGALVNLVSYLSPDQQENVVQEALQTAQAIKNDYSRTGALANLAPHLPHEQQENVLQEAMKSARKIENFKGQSSLVPGLDLYLNFRTIALTNLVPRLAELGHPEQALETARAIGGGSSRAEALANLAPYLSPEQQESVVQEALETARTVEDGSSRARVLADLAPYLSPEQQKSVLQEALETARTIEDGSSRTEALANLVSYLSPEQQESVLQEALETARAIGRGSSRTEALANLVSYLSPEQQESVVQEALKTARAIEDSFPRTRVLTNLAPYLSPKQQESALRAALETARAIENGSSRSSALAKLVPHLAELGQLEQALKTARAIGRGSSRAEALANLAPHLSHGQQENVLQEAMESARKIENFKDQSLLISGLDFDFQAFALTNLVRRIAELGHPEQALETAQAIESNAPRVSALANLTPYLSPERQEGVLQEALETAQAIEDRELRARALAILAPYLSPEQQESVLQEALQTALAIEDGFSRVYVLANLVRHLPPKQQNRMLQVALESVRKIEDSSLRAGALAELVPRLAELGYLQQALEAARTTEDSSSRSSALANLVPHLSPERQESVLQEALQTARTIEDSSSRSSTLSRLVPRLAELGYLQQALEAARTIEDSSDRAAALANLVPHLSPERQESVLQEALQTARTIEDSSSRAGALADLAPHLGEQHSTLLYSLWCDTLPILASQTRVELLSDLESLMPVIFNLGGVESVDATTQAIQDVGRWWP